MAAYRVAVMETKTKTLNTSDSNQKDVEDAKATDSEKVLVMNSNCFIDSKN